MLRFFKVHYPLDVGSSLNICSVRTFSFALDMGDGLIPVAKRSNRTSFIIHIYS
jgi:hypothetical protein